MTLAHRAKLNSQFFYFYFITYDLVYLLFLRDLYLESELKLIKSFCKTLDKKSFT